MNPSPKISVIMSVYNGMPFLKEAVASILNQTYKNFEFIIVDDASTDSSWQYLKSLKDKQSLRSPSFGKLRTAGLKRIKLIRNKKNLGLSASLNKALKLAKGEYIARMDADDVSLPKRFEKQIEFLLKNPDVDLCGTCVKLIDDKNSVIGKVHKPAKDEDIKKMNMYLTGIVHPTWFAKKEVFNKLGGYDPRYDMAEDLDFLIRGSNFSMANLKEELLLWRSPQKRRSKKSIEVMYRKSLAVRWDHFRKGHLPFIALPYLIRGLITTFLFPSELKVFINKKAGLI